MVFHPSGEQLAISHGDQQATVVEVGGGIREYRVGDVDVLDPYPVEAVCDGAHGAPLVPWPNRIGGARYSFDGAEHQLSVTEPSTGNAIHGLLRWYPWRVADRDVDRVTMAAALFPEPGYPFGLDVRVEYRLTDDGLVVTTTATNVCDAVAPYACGQHPYLSAGGGRLDDCTVRVDAATVIRTDPVRQLPVSRDPVEGTPWDLRVARRLGDQTVDEAYADLLRDDDGLAWIRLGRPDGHEAALWVDESSRYLQVFTGDTLTPTRRRRGLGAEPMTAPPDAFRSGEDVTRLEPGASAVTTWGVRLDP